MTDKPLIKIGENLSFSPEDNILTAKEALHDVKIAKRFIKLAKKLRKVAPKASDFLYGHAVMMHAAEASLVDQETGEPILNDKGDPVKGFFEEIKARSGVPSVKWISPDNVKPYKNANGDIFPEAELIKAHKSWVGKPLCKDHKSESVDGIRGIIVDTHYDPKFKRVHALFALDKKNYGDLARKVETGYANCVSMGTAVGRSVCTECANVAATEREYCRCIKSRANYGEINLDLSPIELSLVVNGADGLAKVRNIIASMNTYVQKKQARIDELTTQACVNPTELQSLSDSLHEMQTKLSGLMQIEKTAESEKGQDLGELIALLKTVDDPELKAKVTQLIKEKFGIGVEETESKPAKVWPQATGGGSEPSFSGMSGEGDAHPAPGSIDPSARLARLARTEGDNLGAFSKEISLLRSNIEKMSNSLKQLVSKEDTNMNSARLRARAKNRRAYWLGGGGVNEPTPGKPKYEKEEADKIRDTEDRHMTGEPLETGSEGLHPGDEGKTWETRNLGGKGDKKKADLEARKMQRQALLEQVAKSEEQSKDELKERAMKRRAYWLGGGGINEPTPGKEKYPKEEADKIRDNEDKHLQGIYDMGGTDGMVPGDEQEKKKWLRARLRAKFTKVADDQGNLVKDASRWDVYAGDKLVLSATGAEIFADELEDNWDYLSSKDYGKDVIRYIRTEGFDRVAYLLKGAQPPADPMAAAPADPMAGGAPADPMAAPAGEAPAPEGAEAPAEEPKEEGGVKEKVEAALTKVEESLEDIRKAVTEGGDKLVDIEVKVDEDEGEGGAATPMDSALAAAKEKALEVHALLDESADELALISESLDKLDNLDESTQERVLNATTQALEDSKVILAQAEVVLAKKKDDDDKDEKEDKKDKKEDKEEKEDKKKEAAKKGKVPPQFEKKDDDEKDDKEKAKKDKKDDDEKDDKEKKAQKLLDDALRLRAEHRASLLAKAYGDMGEDEMYALTDAQEGSLMKLLEEEKNELDPEGKPMHPDLADDGDDEKDEDKDDKEDKKKDKEDDAADGDEMCAHDPNEQCANCGGMMAEDGDFVIDESLDSVMASRRSERDQLVAKAGEILGKYELDLGKAENATEPKYFEAHPGGKGTTTELSHTKTDGAKVETISEVHDAMRDVAESGPRNVREAAAAIQEGIVKGAFTAEDVDKLVAEGKVDSAAASYWKQYFAQAPDAGSFGADLSKEFATKKKQAGNDEYKTKLRRAYAVGLQAQDKGLIDNTNTALETYVDSLMDFDDAAFESNKRVVASYSVGGRKSGTLPRVGTDGTAHAMSVTASADPTPEVSLNEQLAQLNWR